MSAAGCVGSGASVEAGATCEAPADAFAAGSAFAPRVVRRPLFSATTVARCQARRTASALGTSPLASRIPCPAMARAMSFQRGRLAVSWCVTRAWFSRIQSCKGERPGVSPNSALARAAVSGVSALNSLPACISGDCSITQDWPAGKNANQKRTRPTGIRNTIDTYQRHTRNVFGTSYATYWTQDWDSPRHNRHILETRSIQKAPG